MCKVNTAWLRDDCAFMRVPAVARCALPDTKAALTYAYISNVQGRALQIREKKSQRISSVSFFFLVLLYDTEA